jgi:hypothetical protein
MDATQAAAEAVTNGATAAKGFTNPLPIGKAIALATDTGIGFLGLAISGWGLAIAVQSAKHAITVAKG